jgi:hypothetical protein
LSQAEAAAMLAAHATDDETDPQRWRRLLNQADPRAHRAHAMIRIAGALSSGKMTDVSADPVARDPFMMASRDVRDIPRQQSGETVQSLARLVFERIPGAPFHQVFFQVRNSDLEETVYRYSYLGSVARMLATRPDR